MRLSTKIILAGLRHPNKLVREEVLRHFDEGSSSPAELTHAAITAIEQFGWQDAFEYNFRITNFPLDERSLHWVLQELERTEERRPTNKNCYYLAGMITQGDPQLLRPNVERILATDTFAELSEEPSRFGNRSRRKQLIERLELAELTPAECWNQLQRIADSIGIPDKFPHELVERGEHLIERIADDAEPYQEEILRSLGQLATTGAESVREDWWRGFMIRLAGEARFEEAIQPLLNQFESDWEWYNEEISKALKSIGTPEVNRLSIQHYPGKEWYVRMYLTGVLEAVHVDEPVELFQQLLENEHEDELRCMLGVAMASHFDPAAIEPVMAIYHEDPEDVERSVILQRVFACAALANTHTEEATIWQLRLEKRQQRYARRSGLREDETITWMEDLQALASEVTEPDYQQIKPEWDDEEVDEFEEEQEVWEPQQPIVREGVRIGRNEPCLCGSGKKYKKCCLKAKQ